MARARPPLIGRATVGLLLLGAAGLLWWPVPVGGAAETTDPSPMSTTLLVLKLDAEEPLAIRSVFEDEPPALTITFPKQRVIGSLPERAAIAKGVIQTVEARYMAGPRQGSPRFLESVRVGLSAAYAHRVRSEAGRIIIEIEHPASVGGISVEIGLRGGTIIEGAGERNVSQRFRAMQEALARVTPTPWSLQISSPALAGDAGVAAIERSSAGTSQAAAMSAPSAPRRFPLIGWIIGLTLAGLAGLAVRFREPIASIWRGQPAAKAAAPRRPSGVQLIDELIWKAFERQGYQQVLETDFAQPLAGQLRVIVKDGSKAALCFVGNGPFFEQQTVEQFVRAMQALQAPQGFLITAGSFTVPAQRMAKAHQVSLIGRDELVGLLSAGAGIEYIAKQMEQQQSRLDEARETLSQYAGELDALRRQRNEASWYLGEERVRSAQLDATVGELTQKLRQYETELARREEDLSTLRRHWEESEWYLGEARVRTRYLESQVSALQDIAKQVEAVEGERDRAAQAFQEERTRREALQTRLAELEQQTAALTATAGHLQATLDQLTQQAEAVRAFGERRSLTRGRIVDARVELGNGGQTLLFAGCPRDVSPLGFGLETDGALPERRSYRVRLSLPGGQRVEANARRLWQRPEGDGQRVLSGYRFLWVPADVRTRIAELVELS